MVGFLVPTHSVDIAEILLKVVLNTIKPTNPVSSINWFSDKL
jgi:hypothetical protein